jgi:hypothetical protein
MLHEESDADAKFDARDKPVMTDGKIVVHPNHRPTITRILLPAVRAAAGRDSISRQSTDAVHATSAEDLAQSRCMRLFLSYAKGNILMTKPIQPDSCGGIIGMLSTGCGNSDCLADFSREICHRI